MNNTYYAQSVTARIDNDNAFWKITLRLMPYLAALWCLAWIDRTNIGIAKLTMQKDLGFSDLVYGAGAGVFFLGYFLFEVPSNVALKVLGARKTIMRITIGWGLICALMMFVKTEWQFYLLRFLLGAFEAGFQPGVLIYLTYWYPSNRRAQAIGIFTSATALSTVIGAPITAYIMEGLHGVNGWLGWQWVFILEGVVTMVAGTAAWWVLKETPQDAPWLTAIEKNAVQKEIDDDKNAQPKLSLNCVELLKNSTFWTLTAIYFCIVAGYATVNFFGPSAIRELGFSVPTMIAWIMSACAVGGAIFQIVIGRHSDKKKEVFLHTAFAIAVGAISLAMMGYFLGQKNVSMALASLFLAISGTASAFPVFWQLPLKLFAGTSALVGVAAINSIANLAGYLAPTFLGFMKDATGTYANGLIVVGCVQFFGVVLLITALRKHKY
ncbi:MFS transporter (plasmid) [Erwinia rhapontici]|uniref:MFS transporter n=1 Tax=Erwinia rhapontici TaxID=55212 RepID=UPI001BB38119|nr:MFS transporter [Erwinia rhapontici]BCQ42451.1 MFS transporter [Erwinia rhapontici]